MFISLQGQIQASVMQNTTNEITVSWADNILLGYKRLSLERCWDVPALLGTYLQPLRRGLNSETNIFNVARLIAKLQSIGTAMVLSHYSSLTPTTAAGLALLSYFSSRQGLWPLTVTEGNSPSNTDALEMREKELKRWVCNYRNKILNPPGLDGAAGMLTGVSSRKAGERVKDKAGTCSSMALSVWLLFISCLLWLAEQL